MTEPSSRPDVEGPELTPCPSTIRCPLYVHYHCPTRPKHDPSSSNPASREPRVGRIARAYLWFTMYGLYAYGLVIGISVVIGLGVARWFRSRRRPLGRG